MGIFNKLLFSLGSYIGETAIRLYGGEWDTEDDDPQGEITISAIYAYFFVLHEGAGRNKG